jgi:hypothetical protein
VNSLFQISDQDDYNNAAAHANEFEYSTGDAQVVRQIVAVGTTWTDIDLAHMATIHQMMVENLDSTNDILCWAYSPKDSLTYATNKLTFTDNSGAGDPDTITDADAGFNSNLFVERGDHLIVSDSTSDDGAYWVQGRSTSILTLGENYPLAAGGGLDVATPTLTVISLLRQTIPAGASILTGKLVVSTDVSNGTLLRLLCPGGATTAKISYIGAAA